MAILILNVGSSSLKATLFDLKLNRLLDAEVKIEEGFGALIKKMDLGPLTAIGHRFVHGGWKYTKPVRINAAILKDLKTLKELAPLHNPECLAVIESSRKMFPQVLQIAVFDTAFHRTLPPAASTYGIPHKLAKKLHIERYGFHGIAHAYLASRVPVKKLITLQLGNGCSAAAILNGKSVETSMGFSPAEGLLMGTRAGDIDFSILEYINKVEKKSLKEITHLLNFESGLLGVSGKTSDVRKLLTDKSPNSRLAIDLFCHRVIKTLGSYIAVLNGVDAIVFSGGIGENAAKIREKICSHFGYLGLKLSLPKNKETKQLLPGEKKVLHAPSSAIALYAIGADEDFFIAKEVLRDLL